jgi:Retroviral aspartyl protease
VHSTSSTKKTTDRKEELRSDDSDEDGKLNTFDEGNDSELLRLMCFINKKPASILIDGGASRNFISDHFIKKAGLKAERKMGG